jgi:glycosyltransferase involved in cell wall biosynthesis
LLAVKKSGKQFVVHICDQADAVYVPTLADIPHLVTCHDLIAIRSALGEFPLHATRFTGKINQRLILRGLRRASLVACVSDTTRQDYKRIAANTGQRLVVIKNPLNYSYRLLPKVMADALVEAVFQRTGLQRPKRYLFHVGGNQWYKNRLGLLRIYQNLTQLGDVPPLVMAGKSLTTELLSFINRSGLSQQVHFVGKVSNEELNALYCRAVALVFPSLTEGFGWPVIEAQAAGCPVIASKLAIFQEIGGEGVEFINPEDAAASAATIYSFLTNPDETIAKSIKLGYDNAALFPSGKMLDAYLEVYKALQPTP